MKLKDSNTEERILEAAKTAFMTHGLYGARMQDIANHAGINKALLHYYFRSKEKLFDHVFEGALSKYFDQMLVFADTSLPVQDRIFKYIDNIIDFLSEYPQMAMFIIKEISLDPELFYERVGHLKPKGVRLLPVLLEGMETGEVPQLDPVIFMMNLHSLCSYPFVASPIFKSICRSSGIADWADPNNEKLKTSVKEFVAFKLRKPEQ